MLETLASFLNMEKERCFDIGDTVLFLGVPLQRRENPRLAEREKALFYSPSRIQEHHR